MAPTLASNRRAGPCPELDCVRSRLLPGVLAKAEQRALAIGIGADRVLIAARAITEDSYVVALAAALHAAFEPLDRIARADCPLRDDQLIDAEKNGLLPLHVGGAFIWIIAPQGLTARHLVTGEHPFAPGSFRLTSAKRLRDYVMQHAGRALGKRAADALRSTWPEFSAARPVRFGAFALIGAAAVGGAVIAFPSAVSAALGAVLAVIFLAWTGLRLVGAATAWHAWRPLRVPPDLLPVYTIIVALYREAGAVAGLIEALERLDYPPERLQIILVLEPDDTATREAIVALGPPPGFEVVISPLAGPRTKPKALNAALALARGAYVAVFDAEDRPAPDQLRRALDVFLTHDESMACVQARLTIDNTFDGWLAAMFTAEYAGLFDVLLPGLSELRLPLPLGGSSNHFRAAALRKAGAWDPYNVTEDADLGMRLARLGYRVAVIGSTTYEEAPARIAPWLRQRTRWFKGWMQTWGVHMRRPSRLRRELGLVGFVAFQLVVGGTVLSALVHPLFFALPIYALATGSFFPTGGDLGVAFLTALSGGALVAGYLTSGALGLIGLARRGLLAHAWVLLLMPLHWLLLSAAALRALYQLVRDPYRWEKTEHGLARTSRRAQNAAVRTRISFRNTGADRPRPPRAAA
jgi:cellulose synthase/poly-beta-1,6-N-acetylglucosamine synthase-like glycosyltransferase